MGMVVNPSRFASAAAPFIFGFTGTGSTDYSSSSAGNTMRGLALQATASGTLKSVHVLGPSSAPTNTYSDFRVVIYAATAAGTWGAKLGETAVFTCLAQGELRDIPLLSDVSITAGNWYAFCIQSDRAMAWRSYGTTDGYSSSDTFSDGAIDPAGATSFLGRNPVLWGSDEVVSLIAAALTVGVTAVHPTLNTTASANRMTGVLFRANKTGPLNYLTIIGSSGGSSAVNFRLAIYDATSATSWGAKLGETAEQNGLGVSEVKKVTLTSTVNVIAGNLYALCLHASANMATAISAHDTGGWYSDTYSDGAASSAGTVSSVTAPALYATTS